MEVAGGREYNDEVTPQVRVAAVQPALLLPSRCELMVHTASGSSTVRVGMVVECGVRMLRLTDLKAMESKCYLELENVRAQRPCFPGEILKDGVEAPC